MAERLELVVIGGGRMGEALLSGFLSSGRDPGAIGVVEPLGSRREELSMGRDLRLVYTPRWNTFRGETNLELHVVDFESDG